MHKRILTYLLTISVFIVPVLVIARTITNEMVGKYEPKVGFNRELSLLEEQQLYLYEQTLKNGLVFYDYVVLKKIAYAESGWRQYDNENNVLRGAENRKDVGIFQINEYYHLSNSVNLNLDIYNGRGNIDYAIYLYKESGSNPWFWSKHIWSATK